MIELTFREKIVALRIEWLRDVSNTGRDKDFWYVMDSISDDLVIKWAERAVKIRNPIHTNFISEEWMSVCNILHYMKNRNPYKESPWTLAQKRKCTFYIITMWDDLEMDHFC